MFIHAIHSGSASSHHLHCYHIWIIVSCLDYCNNLLTGVPLLSFPSYSLFSTLWPAWYFKIEVRSWCSSLQNTATTPFYFIQSKNQSLQWPMRAYMVSTPISLTYLHFSSPVCSAPATSASLLLLTSVRHPLTLGPLHYLFHLEHSYTRISSIFSVSVFFLSTEFCSIVPFSWCYIDHAFLILFLSPAPLSPPDFPNLVLFGLPFLQYLPALTY